MKIPEPPPVPCDAREIPSAIEQPFGKFIIAGGKDGLPYITTTREFEADEQPVWRRVYSG